MPRRKVSTEHSKWQSLNGKAAARVAKGQSVPLG
jgi:hypothetical protein